jgi:hypothetical protein
MAKYIFVTGGVTSSLGKGIIAASLAKLLQARGFKVTLQKFDLILEQTFFCAIPPSMRVDYVSKMNDVLHSKGKIAGLLFDFPLTQEGPPYGGSKEEYLSLFSEKFTIKTIERAHNSIKPRQNKELFFIFEKK